MRVIWSRDAAAEKDAIWSFIADHSVRYADRVETLLEARAESLARVPRQGRPIGKSGLRRLSIPDIQYVIAYRIEDDVIRIMRVWHTAQDRNE